MLTNLWNCVTPSLIDVPIGMRDVDFFSTSWHPHRVRTLELLNRATADSCPQYTVFHFYSFFHISSPFWWAELNGYPFSILMPTTSSPCILLWVITERASRIPVAGEPIPQFTSSNNLKLMKYNQTDYQNVFSVEVVVSWRFTSPSTIYRVLSIFLMPRTSKMKYGYLLPDEYFIQIWKTSFSI